MLILNTTIKTIPKRISLKDFSKKILKKHKDLKVKRYHTISILVKNMKSEIFNVNIFAYFVRHFKNLNESDFKTQIEF